MMMAQDRRKRTMSSRPSGDLAGPDERESKGERALTTTGGRRPAFFRVVCRVAGLVGFALLLSGCVTDKVTGERRFSLVQWSPEEEFALGSQVSPSIEAQYDGVFVDAEIHDYLESLILEMTEHSAIRSEFQFQFQILNSSVPNAFALPGGFVYITRGLLAQLETEGQFISIMGHELGHVEHQHSMHAQSRGIFAGVASAVIGIGGSMLAEESDNKELLALATAGAAALPGLVTLRYDREQELESDRRGVYYAAQMGYDPREGQKTFELFQRLEEQSGGGGTLSILRTHPMNDDRIEEIEGTLRSEYPHLLRQDSGAFRRGDQFQKIVAKVSALSEAHNLAQQARTLLSEEGTASFSQVEALLKGALRIAPDEPLFKISLAEVELERGNRRSARSLLRSALQQYQAFDAAKAHWKTHYYLGSLDLDDGDPSAAVEHLEAATRLYPLHPEPHYALGEAHLGTGQTSSAVTAFQAVLQTAPEGSDLFTRAQQQLQALGVGATTAEPTT